MLIPPSVGESFIVAGRTDELTVAQLIASFADHDKGEAMYLVQSPAGARWILVENDRGFGPRWIGRPVPAEATKP